MRKTITAMYSQLIGLLKAHTDGEAEVRSFAVDTSTLHPIAAGMLAA
jgi:hypothetical protein